jgi:proliferating cell nuclear antigen
MFHASFPNGGTFLKKILQIIKDDIPEPVFIMSPEGITIQSMDKSHVALVNIFIQNCAASSYECDGKYNFGIHCDTMLKILNCAPINSTCVISCESQDKNNLKFIFEGTNNKKSFSMKLLDITTENILIPDNMEHSCSVTLETKELQKCISDLSTFSEEVTIIRYEQVLAFKSEGANAQVSIDKDISENFIGTLSQTYSLKYLSWFTKAAVLFAEVTLAFDKTFPLLLHFENDIVDMQFFLAPKCDEDDEN